MILNNFRRIALAQGCLPEPVSGPVQPAAATQEQPNKDEAAAKIAGVDVAARRGKPQTS